MYNGSSLGFNIHEESANQSFVTSHMNFSTSYIVISKAQRCRETVFVFFFFCTRDLSPTDLSAIAADSPS